LGATRRSREPQTKGGDNFMAKKKATKKKKKK
jgi:hypothetical protein